MHNWISLSRCILRIRNTTKVRWFYVASGSGVGVLFYVEQLRPQQISSAMLIINQTSDCRPSASVYTSEHIAPRDRRGLFIEPTRYSRGESANGL